MCLNFITKLVDCHVTLPLTFLDYCSPRNVAVVLTQPCQWSINAVVQMSLGLCKATTCNKCLANVKKPCDSSVLCLRSKSSLWSPHSILDMMSFISAVRRRDWHAHWCNSGVGQFKPIFQVEGNTFRPIFISYFIAVSLLYNFAAESFHATKLCRDFIRSKLNFIPKRNWIFRHLLRLRRYKRKYVKVSVFRRGWVIWRLNFRLKGYDSRQYPWTVR